MQIFNHYQYLYKSKKNLLINFVTGLPILKNWKKDDYNLIQVMVDNLTKIIYYKLIKTTIDVTRQTLVIIDVVLRQDCIVYFIMSNKSMLFLSLFWLSLYYFLGIKQKFSNVFHLIINAQIKKHNNTIEIYLHNFVNCEQNNKKKAILIAEFI